MKNVKELAKEFGLELPDGFEGKLLENYKTIAEFDKVKGNVDKLKSENEEKEATIKELNDSISEFDGEKGKLEELQQKVADYEKQEEERVKRSEEEKADEVIKNALKEAIGEKEFTNSLVEESIFNKIKSDLGKDENKGKGVKEILEVHTKDVDGVWKNPNKPEVNTPDYKANGGADLNKMSYEEYKAYRKGE